MVFFARCISRDHGCFFVRKNDVPHELHAKAGDIGKYAANGQEFIFFFSKGGQKHVKQDFGVGFALDMLCQILGNLGIKIGTTFAKVSNETVVDKHVVFIIKRVRIFVANVTVVIPVNAANV